MHSFRPLLIALTALTALTAAAGAAVAASLTLTPGTGTFLVSGAPKAQQNTNFQVNLNLDATGAPGANPGLYGGNIVIQFDKTLLQYNGFGFNPGVPALAFFDPPVVSTSGNIQTVTFGFNNAPRTGVVGSFNFKAIGAVNSVANIGLADADDFMGTFISYVPTYQAFYPSFSGTPIGISAIPLPAGVWLLGTALGSLGLRRLVRPRRQP